MRKSIVWRAFWMGAIIVLFTSMMAMGQETEQPSSDVPAESSSSSDAPPPDTVASPGTEDTSNTISGDLYNASSPYTGLPPLGVPAPAQGLTSGAHLGPFYLTGISDSFYYSTVSPQSGSQNNNSSGYGNFWGNNITAGVALTHQVGENGTLQFHAMPQVLMSNQRTWFNEISGLSFTDQLTDRWTLNINTQLAYFENSILTNPQYALVNTSAGYVLQTIYQQTTHPAFYQYSTISASYSLGEKTTLSFTPTAGVSLSNSSGPLNSSYQFGGAVAVSHQYSSKGTVSVFYGLTHSVVPGVNGSGTTNWNSSSFGVGLSQGFGGETWSFAFNVATNTQSTPQLNWSVIGNAALIKRFGDGSSSLSVIYTRSQSALLTLSPGYFDQANITYNRMFGEKWNGNVGVGAYRSNQNVQTVYVNNAHGVRVSGSVGYQILPSLTASAGFFVGQQFGAGGNQYYLFNGRSSSFNVGLTWTPGRDAYRNSLNNPSIFGSTIPTY